MNLGNKIAELRKANKLSQEDLANNLNVSRQSVSLWETNQSSPSTEKLIELAKFFNVSVDDLINSKTIDTTNLTIRTIHSKESYKSLVYEVNNIFQRHFLKFILILIVLITVIIIGDFNAIEFWLALIFTLLIATPVFFVLINYLEYKAALMKIDFKNKNLQKFIFKDNELIIIFEDNESSSVSKVQYQSFKKAIISDHYFYLEHPKLKRNFFQMDLNDFLSGNKDALIAFMNKKEIAVKEVKSKNIKLSEPTNNKTLFKNKSLFYTLIGMLVLSFSLFLLSSMILNKADNEITSYYSSRSSLSDISIYSLLVIPLIVVFVYTIYLSKQKYKSRLILVSYIFVPILTLLILLMTLIIPFTYKGSYSKDYTIVADIFKSANLYLPEVGLSISESHFKTTEDNLNTLPYKNTHKILVNNNLDLFEESLVTNNNWVTELSLLMKAKLNIFIEKEADYYLIYNETADNYNDDDLISGLNKLYVFYYYFQANEIIIYEFYLV